MRDWTKSSNRDNLWPLSKKAVCRSIKRLKVASLFWLMHPQRQKTKMKDLGQQYFNAFNEEGMIIRETAKKSSVFDVWVNEHPFQASVSSFLVGASDSRRIPINLHPGPLLFLSSQMI